MCFSNKQLLTHSLIILAFFTQTLAQSPTISGELKKWHNIILTFTGPSVSEASSTTFLDYRMDLSFTHPASGKNIVVPGYFAADGDAANTSATTGDKWRVHFRPSETGTWNYVATFLSGTHVAIGQPGVSAGYFDGATGTLNIAATDKVAPDLRARGRLQYVDNHHLKYAETGEYFLKFGPDSPENFLDYADFDFDASYNNCGNACFLHDYSPHVSDHQPGDPTWGSNLGKGIIGALNFLADQYQVNSFSMSLLGGDDKNVYPWRMATFDTTLDVSKLAQWEIVFDHAEKKGLFVHYKLSEAENWNILGDTLNTAWRFYYREMIARFGHHLGLEWNLGEEFGGIGISGGQAEDAAEEAADRAAYIQSIDPWQSPRVVHTGKGVKDPFYQRLIDIDAPITGASLQNNSVGATWPEVFVDSEKWTDRSSSNNLPWTVASDEQAPANRGVFTGANLNVTTVEENGRTDVLWGNLIAGGSGVMWYAGAAGDFKIDDFAKFDTLFDWCRYAVVDFFYGNDIPFQMMVNHDSLVNGADNHCLAQLGEHYVIQLSNGGSTDLDLSAEAGNYRVRWFNPRTGGGLLTGAVDSVQGGALVNTGNPPFDVNEDWIVYLVNNSNAVLPVGFASVRGEARGNRALISWEVSQAVNSLGFEVEMQSSETDYFQSLGFVPSLRNADPVHSYQFESPILEAGRYYFRIKHLDIDGKVQYSKSVQVNLRPSEQTTVRQYPNPFDKECVIEVQIPHETHLTLEVFSLKGHRISTLHQGNLPAGRHTFTFSGLGLPEGIYLYKISGSDFHYIGKSLLRAK